MNSSESPKSSSRAAESGSRSHRQRPSTDSTDPPSSTPANILTPVDYSALDPFTLNNTSFRGQLPSSPHTVNPSDAPGNNSFLGFSTTQPLLPQYQPQPQPLMMWPFTPQQPFASNVPLAGGPSAFMSPQPPVDPYPPATGPSRPTLQHISPVPSTTEIHSSTPSTQEHSTVDPEEAAVVEDKRRRNTAASARFRIKKKQKNLNLERTVSDLTSRAKELEREATNLRRENSWLKEMVMMKGRRNLAGSGRHHEKSVSSDSEGDDRDDDVAEGSDLQHVDKPSNVKTNMKGKSKANSHDIGNSKSQGKGR